MVPIHDTDLAAERWSKAEWEHYELWEKIEQRFRRRRRLWILATLGVFIVLSSVPVVMDRWPHWMSQMATRRLAQEINTIKREASIEHLAFRIRFDGKGALSYTVAKINHCGEGNVVTVRSGSLLSADQSSSFALISPPQADELSLPGLVEEYCYDPLPLESQTVPDTLTGFGIIPVKDLTAESSPRQDRLALMLLNGPSSELSF